MNIIKRKSKRLSREVFLHGLQIIKRYLEPHNREIYSLAILSIGAALSDGFVPYIAGRIFDGIINIPKDPSAALQVIFLTLSVWFLFRFIGDIADWRIMQGRDALGNKLYAEYISNASSYLLLLPMEFHKNVKHGEINQRINRAANWINNIVENVLISLAPRFLSIFIGLAVAFYLNWVLASFLMSALIVYATTLAFSVSGIAEHNLRAEGVIGKAFNLAYDAHGNVQEIKQATAEEYERRRIFRKFSQAAERWVAMSKAMTWVDFVQSSIITLTQLVIFAVSAWFVYKGRMTPGALVSFNGYAAMVFGPFATLGRNWHTIQNGFLSLTKAEKILEEPPERYVPESAVIVPKIRGSVEFKNVSFGYKKDKRLVLEDISFSINPGETVALVGASGVGKTTLIGLIGAFYFPKKGKILIDGHDVKNLDLKNYRSHIAVVPQELALFNDTVEANIRYGAFGAASSRVKWAAEEAHADEFINKFPKKYKQVVGWRGIKLSTGQKQRIAIARALLRDPRILILDEPTSALDAATEEKIKESLEKLMKGRTTFIIAHRLSTVRRANKIFVLDKGRIAEVGAHEELLAKGGIYTRLYNLQFRGKSAL
ncbi:MAG: ABC transporter ATP-binding protein [Candidatus Sungbacteria bacterium]|nr:ABC transporter ATP-binding protein [Candidatus Sungbacteria bacterium]